MEDTIGQLCRKEELEVTMLKRHRGDKKRLCLWQCSSVWGNLPLPFYGTCSSFTTLLNV